MMANRSPAVNSSPPPGENFGDLLEDLKTAARITAKQRSINISKTVDKICAKAYQDGIPNASLEKLVDIITLPAYLDQGSLGKLIKILYPASKVSDAVVVRVVGSLGHGRSKPPFPAQVGLLKWLVMVYDVLERPAVLSSLYTVIFNLLDTVAIRAPLCHVLSLITRRKHVRSFRIQLLMELTRRAGNDPPLVGLMRVFKDYYPDVIVGSTLVGRASVFTHPNQEWRQRLGEIQDIHLQRTQDGLPPEQKTFRVTRKGINGSTGVKSSVIPGVYTANAHETSTTLEEIDDVNDFIQKLEKIQLPNQMVAVFGDPLLQKLLQLNSSNTTSQRIDYWLTAFFEDQLQNPESWDTAILEMLTAILGYARLTKSLPNACIVYFQLMLPTWNGITGRQVILDLLTYLPMTLDGIQNDEDIMEMEPWEQLHRTIFEQLEDALLEDDTTESKLALLAFYKNLLLQWSLIPSSSPENNTTLNALANHASNLAHTIAQSHHPLSIPTASLILDLYTTLTTLSSLPTPPIDILYPPAPLLYTLYFHPTLSLPLSSRICALLALLKRAYESTPKVYRKETVNRFNGFLMDICNCIWRGRAFNTTDPNALGCLLPASLLEPLAAYVRGQDIRVGAQEVGLGMVFGLSFGGAMCGFALESLRRVEDETEGIVVRHAGPATGASLKKLRDEGGVELSWEAYRLGVLSQMDERGVNGVGELMFATLKQLLAARQRLVAERAAI